jgi:dihydroflavonol-4-reductase
MKKLWLVTGATGHVGTILVSVLQQRGEHVRALVRPSSSVIANSNIEICEGDIGSRESLIPFFDRGEYDYVSLIHCAALITIASKHNPEVWNINVHGTNNVMSLAKDAGVDRIIYVSSVHAIPEKPANETITEVSSFSPNLVHGQYAKSKAAAAQIVMDYAKAGLNVSIVHPSGIIGPGDTQSRNHMIRTIRAMAEGKISVGLQGGYDFVDSRDVVDGIIGCEEKGRPGECYILNGHYIGVLELVNTVRRIRGKKATRLEAPHTAAKMIAPAVEWLTRVFSKEAPLLTPYSVYTLHTNGRFSHEKATREFDYHPRLIEDSIRDSL